MYIQMIWQSLYPNKSIFFLLIAIVKYNTVFYNNNVIIILWISLIIFKNIQLECILHYLFEWQLKILLTQSDNYQKIYKDIIFQ